MSRVDAVRIAVEKARELGHDLDGAVLASDAFFPFPDGPQIALEAGVAAIIQPGGSKRDAEVTEAVSAAGAAMVFTHRGISGTSPQAQGSCIPRPGTLEALLRRGRVRLSRARRLRLDTGAVAKRELGDGIEDRASWAAGSGHQDDARTVPGADEDVLGHRRAVEEVPGPQAPFLSFDQQQALPGEDQEVLLRLLAVVEAVRLSRLRARRSGSRAR